MKEIEELDGMTKLAGLLCAGPVLVTIMRFGWPYTENFILILISILILGAFLAIPQLGMLFAVYMSTTERTRTAALWISGAALIVYAIYAFTLDLTSNSTASLSLSFFQVLAAGVSFLVLGLIVVIIRRANR